MNEVGFRYEVQEQTPEGVRAWLVHEDYVDDILENCVGKGNYYEVHKITYLEQREVVKWESRLKSERKAVIIPFPSAAERGVEEARVSEVPAAPQPMPDPPSSIRFHKSPSPYREEKVNIEPEKERKVQQRCVSCAYEWQSRFHTDCPACHEDRFRGVEVISVDWGV